jgi:diphthamide biosynthesis protein 7
MPAQRLDTFELPLPADVAEWCPTPGAQRVLAVGTYQLDEQRGQRLGALHLFRLDSGGTRGGSASLIPLGTASGHPLPGIFDLRWRPRSAMPQLAAALADGSLQLLDWSCCGNIDGGEAAAAVAVSPLGDAAGEVPLPPPRLAARLAGPAAADREAGGASAMAVSLDFSRAQGCAGEQLVASYSSGQLQLFQVGGWQPGWGSCWVAVGRLLAGSQAG